MRYLRVTERGSATLNAALIIAAMVSFTLLLGGYARIALYSARLRNAVDLTAVSAALLAENGETPSAACARAKELLRGSVPGVGMIRCAVEGENIRITAYRAGPGTVFTGQTKVTALAGPE